MKSIVILISGRGSNMEAIVNASLPLEIRAVISNRPDANGLAFATAKGIKAITVDHKVFSSREDFDAALAQQIDTCSPDYIVLAGFMRILSDTFIARYAGRIVNIHPSLLPSFPGLHTHRQALAAGVKLHGATIHLVTPRLDHGPIIAQAAVPVFGNDTEESLGARVLAQEHRLYPAALKWLAGDRLELMPGGIVKLEGEDSSPESRTMSLCQPDLQDGSRAG